MSTISLVTDGNHGIRREVCRQLAGPTGGFFRDGRPVPW